MPEYADIYSLYRSRDRPTIYAFLERFMPDREETADEYEIPQYADSPSLVLHTASELLDYCCLHSEEVNGVYWQSIGGSRPEHGMVFFHADGSMVLGLSTDASDQDFVDQLCCDLGKIGEPVASYITHEDLPPPSADAFVELVQSLPVVQLGEDQNEIRSGRARRLGTLPIRL